MNRLQSRYLLLLIVFLFRPVAAASHPAPSDSPTFHPLPADSLDSAAVSQASRYFENNDYIPGAFPAEVSDRIYSIPLNPSDLLIIYPEEAEGMAAGWRTSLQQQTGQDFRFLAADEVTEEELSDYHLIVIGSLNDNPRVEELYMRRHAFADDYFPGVGGYIIHPAPSAWNRDRNLLVIGASQIRDLEGAFDAFLQQLKPGQTELGVIRTLQTDLEVPQAPVSVDQVLDRALENAYTSMAPYGTIANWGLSYHISGDERWAEHFRDAFYMMRARARRTGRWISESWTNVYFNHWKLVYVWDLIDDDPLFSQEDREVVEEVLWGFTTFVRWLPNLDPDQAPPGEMRQNHTTFLALSLSNAHRYYTVKYNLEGLDSMMEKVHLAFEDGQANSFIANDDAGGYLKYGSLHTLMYLFGQGDMRFVDSGKLAEVTDLLTTVFDNRGQQVSFGDVGGYAYRDQNSVRDPELAFFSMAARFYDEPHYRWFYQWLNGAGRKPGSGIDLQTVSLPETAPSSEETTKRFSLDALYSGDYVTKGPVVYPEKYTGINVVDLDAPTRKWFGRRSWDNHWLPDPKERYFHKIAFRQNFSADDEYLLLDGINALSHGHHDANTILRLTWKDRIWLFDLDYIKVNTKYHNGVTVSRDGIQEDPPSLTALDYSINHSDFGITRTSTRKYNGADWERTILWQKGEWFLVLDQLEAREAGTFRLTNRWRTRGDRVQLDGNRLHVVQGGKMFQIKSADTAHRRLEFEPDVYRSDWSNYPWGEGGLDILVADKTVELKRGEEYQFVNLLSAYDSPGTPEHDLLKASDHSYLVTGSDGVKRIGLESSDLETFGLLTDADFYVIGPESIFLANVSVLQTSRQRLFHAEAASYLILDLVKGEVRDHEGRIIRKADENLAGVFSKVSERALSADAARYATAVQPEPAPRLPGAFGIEPGRTVALPARITAMADAGEGMLAGDADGGILLVKENGTYRRFMTEAGSAIRSVAAGDLDGDGMPELLAGDEEGNLYAYRLDGQRIWQKALTPYYGRSASVNDIAIRELAAGQPPVVLAGNSGWKVTAVKPSGELLWEGQTFYHALTKVDVLKIDENERVVLAGNSYHSPLNVIDPEKGTVLFHTWEEMGSEFISTTDYFGYHLTEMTFLDANEDGRKDVIFGTLSNHLYALDAADGAKIWEANAGGEVSALISFTDSGGSARLLAGNDNGDLLLMNRSGESLKRISLHRKISGIYPLPIKGDRNEFAVTTESGLLVIVDQDLLIRAIHPFVEPLQGVLVAGTEGRRHQLVAVGSHSLFPVVYEAFFLRESRHY